MVVEVEGVEVEVVVIVIQGYLLLPMHGLEADQAVVVDPRRVV